jgi:hypothetical protein
MVVVNKEIILAKVQEYLSGKITRETLAEWARGFYSADHRGEILFEPERRSADLWAAISNIEGFDLRHGGPDEPYLYEDDQLQDWLQKLH